LSAALASAMVDGLGVRAAFVIGAFGSTLAGTYSLSQGVFRDFGATLIIETVAEEAAA
jgi:hypothetical protein